MPAKIRLKKVGRKGQPSYRVVVLDGRKPRDAKVVADLGPYDPKTNPPTFEIDGDAALKWLLEGAKPTRAARNILSNAGVMAAWDAAKRGETVAIEAKELKPDKPKKKPQPEAVAEEPAAAESEEPAAEEEAAEEPAAEEPVVEEVVEEPAAEEAAAEEPVVEESADSDESEAEEEPAADESESDAEETVEEESADSDESAPADPEKESTDS
ncbi:30S ribosomal protein S16 [Candidatus Bipolaricaulota bacterium]